MAENIVIVESPTKSKTIKNILNINKIDDLKNFEVLSTKGHIFELVKNKGKYGLGIDLDKYEPIYQVIPEKKELVKIIANTTKQAKNVFIATDPDREGEAIGYHLSKILNLSPEQVKRIEFYEITKKGILSGIKNPREIDINLVNSQEARRLLDRIVGFRLSKLLQYKILSKSAGRVQSVALKLICDQEKLISEFKPETYFTIIITLENDVLVWLNNIKNDQDEKVRINDAKIANDIVKNLDKTFLLKNIVEKITSIQQPNPLITSTILQKSPYSTKSTEMILQKLFEGIKVEDETIGLITYHRTDSTRLSEEFVKKAQACILDKYGKKYLAENKVIKNNNAKTNIQDAHEAIRPTYLKYSPSKMKNYLTSQELTIYSLIYNYALASQMAPSQSKNKKYIFLNNGYEFICNSSKVLFPGFKLILNEVEEKQPANKKLDNFENKVLYENDKVIFKLNENYKDKNKEILAHETQPPARYSEAKLIRKLEKLGIGRPSTYGKIINNILTSGYINLLNRQFKPTIRGMFTNDFLQNHFNNYISESFTADMENKLDQISKKEIDEKSYIENFFKDFNEQIDDKNTTITPQYAISLNKICPKCNKGNLVIRHGKYGDFISCDLYPECDYVAKIDNVNNLNDNENNKNNNILQTVIDHDCPKCGSKLVMRVSKKTRKPFIGCSNYPKCNYLENIQSKNQKDDK